MPAGTLAIVLHAHLPFVRHPEHQFHLEEHWFYEAITATYLPLLEVFSDLARDGVDYRVTLSMSPPLCHMLRDDLLGRRARAHMDRLLKLGEQELARKGTHHGLAQFYLERFTRLRDLWDATGGDLVDAFRRLEDAGYLEIITVGATHGYLPNIREPAARRAQIRVAADEHRRHFGRWPRGIWLPECGYADGVDDLLAEAGIRYFFVDAHGLLNGRPRPPHGTAAPIFTRAGVAAFGRDLESSRQVWSAEEGYPGDPDYREFYRDIGFDRPLAEILPFIHPDGIRLHTGFKYQRVTGKVDLADKAPYDPQRARERAEQHAGNFLFNRQAQIRHLAGRMGDQPPIIVSPYDAELFGHWWFEGPQFLDFLCRRAAFQDDLRVGAPADYLDRQPSGPVVDLSPSSWGEGGYSAVWIHRENDWIYRHQHFCEARMVEMARRHAQPASGLMERALRQAAREVLLLQSSDWAFILKTQTAVGYARARVEAHIARFRRLDREISSGVIDEAWLTDLESRDNIFAGVDFRIFS